MLIRVTYGNVVTEKIIAIPSNSDTKYIPIGCFYIGPSENLTVTIATTNKTVALNNMIYNGNNVSTSASVGVYVR